MMFVYLFTALLTRTRVIECDLDDPFCSKINKIERRILNPKHNISKDLEKQFAHAKNITESQLTRLNITGDLDANSGLIEEGDKVLDLKSKLIPSYLISKTNTFDNKESARLVDKFFGVFNKKIASIKKDNQNGWIINGVNGTFTFFLEKSINARKFVIPFVENLNCSVQQFSFVNMLEGVTDAKGFGPYHLLRGVSDAQEFVLPSIQKCRAFKIVVSRNYGDDHVCFNGAYIFED